jgi:hypothetical protein
VGTFLLSLLLIAAHAIVTQGTAQYAGCPIFTPNDYYNERVDNARVDAHSQQYILGALDAGNTGGFWAAAPAAEFINIADERTPRVVVHEKVPYHHFHERFPWAPDFRISPLLDAHAMVVDVHSCRLYETYDTSYDGQLSAYSGAVWDLRRPFVPLSPGTPSSMASGLSIFSGMIKWEEVQAGHIDHALNWTPPAGTAAEYDFVRPASYTDGHPFNGRTPYALPYGAHLRLKRSFDISRFGPQARVIAQAMKTYGIYLADTGSKGNGLYNAAPLSGEDRWDASDLAALDSIHITDFEVLALPQVQRVRR